MSHADRNSGTHFLNLSAYNRFRSFISRRSDSSVSDAESIQSIQSSRTEEQGDPSLRIFLDLSAYNRFRSLVSRRSNSSISDAESIQSSRAEDQVHSAHHKIFALQGAGEQQREEQMGLEFEPAFIQEAEHRPKPTISEAGSIPLIDLSPLLTTPIPDDGDEIPEALRGLVAEVEAACADWGFFQVINHGVPLQLLEGVQTAAKEFFALPMDEKRRVGRDEVNPLGYYDTEHTRNVRDWKEVFDFVVNEPVHIQGKNEQGEATVKEINNQWPEYPPQMREACKEYQTAVQNLSYTLLELIALTLKLPAKRFNDLFKDSTSFIRLNHYPPCPSPDLALGVGRHKDAGALTVLAQDDVGGLDVKRKSDGEWVRVKPIPNSYIINVGDMIQVWSNDRYESPEHRVSVNSDMERFSIPFFFNPAYNVNIKPLEELVSEENPTKYHEFNWGEFFTARANSNYEKKGAENLQIYHFRMTG